MNGTALYSGRGQGGGGYTCFFLSEVHDDGEYLKSIIVKAFQDQYDATWGGGNFFNGGARFRRLLI